MRGNGSFYPNKHQHPLKVLQSLNHPLIPKLISYDDEYYECEFIEGETLIDYTKRTRDVKLAMSIVKDTNAFFHLMAVHEHGPDRMASSHGDGHVGVSATHIMSLEQLKVEDGFKYRGNLILSADDIHEQNIMVTSEGRPYIVDLDQFGWYHPYYVFKLIQFANIRVCDGIHTGMLLGKTSLENFYEMKHRNELVINKQNIRIKKLEAKLLSLV